MAELKLAFWVDMLTKRHDGRLWRPHLAMQFPGLPTGMALTEGRKLLRAQLDKVRQFRNRVAHHEPIFGRSLAAEHARMRALVVFRSHEAAAWLDSFETVSALLRLCP